MQACLCALVAYRAVCAVRQARTSTRRLALACFDMVLLCGAAVRGLGGVYAWRALYLCVVIHAFTAAAATCRRRCRRVPCRRFRATTAAPALAGKTARDLGSPKKGALSQNLRRRNRKAGRQVGDGARRGTSTEPELECVVCLESLQCDADRASPLKPCAHHQFHQHCIDSWLSIQRSCPLCRRKVDTASQRGGDGYIA